MATSDLNVWYQQTHVGKLWADVTGKIGFHYSSDWIKTGFALSIRLPLTDKPYQPEDETAHRFFANLLPEEGARAQLSRQLKIPNDDYAMLKALGGECAGAFSILPADVPNDPQQDYRQINEHELTDMIACKNFIPIESDDKKPRLSLAGAQNKCPIYIKDDRYYLPLETACSSHIIKFEVTQYRNVPAYECYLAQLAKQVSLPVANTQLKKQSKSYYLLIERYDRYDSQGELHRLHQEDLCQALGYSHNMKYQQDGGPSFADCYHLVKSVSSNGVRDLELLLKWQIFNFLAGNSDGHAKNLALLYDEKHKPALAPFYDLVCTRAIEHIDHKLAMAIGNQYDPDKVTLKDWETLADDCQIRFTYLTKLVTQLATRLLSAIESSMQSFEDEYGPYPALQRANKIITKQCQRALAHFDA